MDWSSFVLGALSILVLGVLTGFVNAAGTSLWDVVLKRLNPPPPPPRERRYMTSNQFQSWTGAPRSYYEARRSEGYEFTLQPGERVPALEHDGWEKMVVEDLELWWLGPHRRIASAFLMRRAQRR